MGKGKQQPIPLQSPIPSELAPLLQQLTAFAQGRLQQPSPNLQQQQVLGGFFGSQPNVQVPLGGGVGGGGPSAGGGVLGSIGLPAGAGVLGPTGLPGAGRRVGSGALEPTWLPGANVPRPPGTGMGVPTPIGTPVQLGGPGPNQGGFFGGAEQFLGGLMRGELPAALREQAQRNLQEGQQALNAQLQSRGAYYSSAAVDAQRKLAEDYARNLQLQAFQGALGAIPQGLQLYGGAAGLAGIPSEVPPIFGQAGGLLGATRGVQPTYAPDPWSQLLGLLPFFIPGLKLF